MRTYIYHNLPRLAQWQALTRYTPCLTPTVLTRNRKPQYCLLEPVVAQRRLLFLSTAVANVSQDHIVRCPLPDLDIPTNVPFHQFIFDKCDVFKNRVAVVSIREIYFITYLYNTVVNGFYHTLFLVSEM